jgi:transcriptional regulator with XRE-family HTH domain
MPVPAVSKRFGLTVRKHRTEAGLTQETLAERAGLHATYIGMVERGVRNPTLDVALRIAKGLEADLPVLLSEALSDRGGKGRRE